MRLAYIPLVFAVIAALAVSGCLQAGDMTGRVISVDTGNETGQPSARQCPATCSDGNPCTTDFCSEQTDFKCRNIPLTGKACGENSVCKEGVCQENSDNCSIIYGIGGVSDDVKDEEAEDCYLDTYIGPAVASGDFAICDEIVLPSFVARCYAAIAFDIDENGFCEDAGETPAVDECYFTYASMKADEFIFDEGSCSLIADPDKKEKCMQLESVVTAPVGVKEFYAAIVGDSIHSYIVLKDIKGRTTVADGNLTVYIKQEDAKGEELKRLYSKTFNVKKEDFELTSLSGFGEQDIAYVIGPIRADDFEELPSENYGTFYVTFYTTAGKSFFQSKELRF